MKKSFVAILFAAALLSLAACKTGTKSEQATDSTQMAAPATQTAAPADTTHAAMADTTKAK